MIYKQSTGQLCSDSGELLGCGHAGNGDGLNNPAMQFVHNIGPLPVGRYKIGAWGTHVQLGPISAPLIPQPVSNAGIEYAWLHGRGGFYIHGPIFSEGCIVMDYGVRLALSKGTDADLTVVS